MGKLEKSFREDFSNKTAGYHHLNLVKMQFWNFERWKRFFFEKTLFLHHTFKFFQVLPKKILYEGGKDIFKKYYHMIRILQQIYYLYRFWKTSRFFSKNPYIFWKKKPKFWTFWEITLSQSHSTANSLQFDEKNWQSDTSTTDVGLFSASSIGKHRVKKRTYLRGRFCFPYFQYSAK